MPPLPGWLLFTYSVSLTLTLLVFVYSATRRWAAGTGVFALIIFFEAVWIFGNICELLAPSLSAKLFWDNIQYLPTGAIPPALLSFSLIYPSRRFKNTLQWPAGLGLVMAILLLALFTNGFQGGPRPGASLVSSGGLVLLTYPFNTYDWLVSLYAYLVTLVALGLLLRTAIQQRASLRLHTLLIMAGYAMPLLATVLTLAGISIGPQRDHSPFFIAVGNLLVLWGMLRFRLFNMLPAARVLAVENIHDALVVLDLSNNLVDLNPAAQALFKLVNRDIAGLDASMIFPPELPAELLSSTQPETVEILLPGSSTTRPDPRIFELAVRPIFNQRQQLAGRLLVFHDLTERKHREAMQRMIDEKRIQRESEAKFQTTIEQFSEGFVLVDQRGMINEWNHAMEAITGIPRSSAVNMPYWDVQALLTIPEQRSPERVAFMKSVVLETLATGRYIGRPNAEFYIECANGGRKFIAQNAFTVQIGSEYWLGSANRDITAQKQAQLSLERYLARLRVLHEIDRAILAAEKPAGVVTAALDGLYQFLPFHGAGVILDTPLPDGACWLLRSGETPCFRQFPPLWRAYFEAGPDRKILLETPKLSPEQVPACERCLFAPGRLEHNPADQRLIVALRSEGRLIGALHLCLDQPLDFDGEVIEIVTEASDQLAIALQQETLRAQTQRRVHELTVLHGISNLLNYQHPANDPLAQLTDHIAQLLNARRCLLILRTDDGFMEAYYPAHGFTQAETALIRWQPPENERQNSLWTRGYYIGSDAADIEPGARDLFTHFKVENILAVTLRQEDRMLGVLAAVDKTGGFHADDVQLLTVVASQAAQLIINARLFQQLSNAYDATITGWSKALEQRERETKNHSERVTGLARRLAQRLGLSKSELEDFSRGVLLHDIGKMGIPDEILLKAGPLDAEQWGIMRQHPVMAYELLKDISFLHNALDVPYCHHERWDGSGYPRGLKGDEIPLTARLFTVVDVWDALTNDRVYRRAWSAVETASYLRENAGILFDPHIVDEFLIMLGE